MSVPTTIHLGSVLLWFTFTVLSFLEFSFCILFTQNDGPDRLSVSFSRPPSTHLFLLVLKYVLNTLQTSHAVQDFNRQELNRRRGGETSPNGNKSTPQTGNTIALDRLDHAIGKAIVNFLVRGLIHQVGTNTVKGRNLCNEYVQ